MATICLLRTLLLIPAGFLHPELLNTFEVVAAIVWAVAGIGFAVGFATSRSSPVSRPGTPAPAVA